MSDKTVDIKEFIEATEKYKGLAESVYYRPISEGVCAMLRADKDMFETKDGHLVIFGPGNEIRIQISKLGKKMRRQAAKKAILLVHRLNEALQKVIAQPFSDEEFTMIAFEEGSNR